MKIRQTLGFQPLVLHGFVEAGAHIRAESHACMVQVTNMDYPNSSSRRALLAAAFGLPLWARPGKIKITGLELVRLDGHWQAPSNDHQYQVNPSHVYEELR